jgi:citrate/tricarballylate utilization protein
VQQLEALVSQAQALAEGHGQAEGEVARQLQICNACRYCESFCAVFPAMTRRLEFPSADVHYLANLCHNCGACLHACQYAPPHEFAVNVPRAMARVRRETYAQYAWPAPLAALVRRNGLAVALVLTLCLAVFLALGAAASGGLWRAWPGGDFYAIFPHGWMVSLFGPVFIFALLALAVGVARFWRCAPPGAVGSAAAAEAVHDGLRLRYLDGGHGEGCHEESDRWTHARRIFHHLTFYGFLLCLAATSVATVYHYAFGWVAPYGFSSLPKVLGMTGGAGLVIGTVGLARLRWRRHPQHVEPGAAPMDVAFVSLLFIVAASGLALALARSTAAMPLLLCLHLGSVMAFFLTMPYGKFAHGVYRLAALLKWAVEKRLANPVQAGSD